MSRTRDIVLTAVITAVVTSGLWVLGLVIFVGLLGLANDSAEATFDVVVRAPEQVRVGERFTLHVETRNVGEEPKELGSIDLYDSFMDGFEVLGSTPRASRTLSVGEFRSFFFSESVAPGETVIVSFDLKPVKAGNWIGQVDACTPSEAYQSAYAVVRVLE